jgi:hypothetical protein
MHSTSQSARSNDTFNHRLADLVGTVIALLTLTLPLFVVDYYSSTILPEEHPPLTYDIERNVN